MSRIVHTHDHGRVVEHVGRSYVWRDVDGTLHLERVAEDLRAVLDPTPSTRPQSPCPYCRTSSLSDTKQPEHVTRE